MKSFSSTTFASDDTLALERARAAVGKNPLALFSDFQWYLYEVHNTVWWTAFSTESFDKAKVNALVGDIVALAPQLTHGFVGARPGEPLPQAMLNAITEVVETDSFDGYPDAWLESGSEMFVERDLPLFRVKALVRRGGPDNLGRQSMILVRSAHALMEGADSALLTRGQSANHGVMSDRSKKPSGAAAFARAFAWVFSPIHLIMAYVMAPKPLDFTYASVSISRRRLRTLARKVGVRSRSLMFALVMHALNGTDKRLHKHFIAVAYTMLDGNRNAGDDDFFRVRGVDGRFPVMDDIVDFARAVDASVDSIESKNPGALQTFINAIFGVHRRIQKVLPFLYSRRFFRFSGPYQLVLTLVPPHRTYGALTHGVMEPIFCGSYHPGLNLVTFCPAKEFVTFNFAIESRLSEAAGRMEELLGEIESRDIPVIATAIADEADAA